MKDVRSISVDNPGTKVAALKIIEVGKKVSVSVWEKAIDHSLKLSGTLVLELGRNLDVRRIEIIELYKEKIPI